MKNIARLITGIPCFFADLCRRFFEDKYVTTYREQIKDKKEYHTESGDKSSLTNPYGEC